MSSSKQALIEQLDKICELIERSEDAIYSNKTNKEILQRINRLKLQLSESGTIDTNEVILLFAPTGSIQEISIDNGWGNQFLQIAQEVDKLVKNK